jgi:hypothetical protein
MDGVVAELREPRIVDAFGQGSRKGHKLLAGWRGTGLRSRIRHLAAPRNNCRPDLAPFAPTA